MKVLLLCVLGLAGLSQGATQLEKCLCDKTDVCTHISDSMDLDSTCEDYVHDTVQNMFAGPLLFVLFVGIAIWRCGRCCCSSCGDSIPNNKNCDCCPSRTHTDPTAPEYTTKERTIYRAVLGVLCFVGILGFGLPLFLLNPKIDDGVNEAYDLVLETGDHAKTLITVINGGLVQVAATGWVSQDMLGQMSSAQKDISDAYDKIADYRSDINKFESDETYSRKISTTAFTWVLIFVFVCVGVMGAAGCSVFYLPGVLFILMCFVVFLLMLLTIVHQAASVTLDKEMCGDYQLYGSILEDYISDELTCAQPGSIKMQKTSGMSGAFNQYQDLKMHVYNDICATYLAEKGPYCTGFFDCQKESWWCNATTKATVANDVYSNELSFVVKQVLNTDSAATAGDNSGLTILECSANCTETLKTLSTQFIQRWEGMYRFLQSVDARGIPGMYCNPVLPELIESLESPLCDKVGSSMTGLFYVCVFAMLHLCIIAVVMTLASKRFVVNKESTKEASDSMYGQNQHLEVLLPENGDNDMELLGVANEDSPMSNDHGGMSMLSPQTNHDDFSFNYSESGVMPYSKDELAEPKKSHLEVNIADADDDVKEVSFDVADAIE